ncbi:MAG: hypothetical protein AAF367_13090 [Pseudomonadota bacterium]
MTPDEAYVLKGLTEQVLLRDLAVLSKLMQQDEALVQRMAAERAAVSAERAAVSGAEDMEIRARMDSFAAATERRAAQAEAARASLIDPISAARGAAQRAFGRSQALDLLASRAAQAERAKANRAAERAMTALALAKAAKKRDQRIPRLSSSQSPQGAGS